jgi:hypothetical protein
VLGCWQRIANGKQFSFDTEAGLRDGLAFFFFLRLTTFIGKMPVVQVGYSWQEGGSSYGTYCCRYERRRG